MGCGLAAVASPAATASSLPSGFQDTVVFSGLEEPTTVRFSPDGRVFVAEKTGKILVFDGLGDTTPTVFADFRTDVYDSEDRGLLGMVLDPDFPSHPYVYALYTYDHVLGDPSSPPKWGEPDHTGDACPHPEGACEVSGRLVRLTAKDGGASDEAVDDGGGHPLQQVLVEGWCQQFSSHSIGDLEFDSSGALYASGGDGASFNATDWGQYGFPDKNPCGDPPTGFGGNQTLPDAEGGALRSQDVFTPSNPLDPTRDPTGLNGSVIRIDPNTGEGLPGNPMSDSFDPNERRIIAYGFRNPFRFAIDPASDEIYVGNVGWVSVEEIDRFPTIPGRAYNSGWPCYEGLVPNDGYQGAGLSLCERLYEDPGAVTPPFFHYDHAETIIPGDACPDESGWAVAGLDVYHGAAFPPAYDGALFFSDAVRGCIYVMMPGADGRPDPLTTTTFVSEAGSYSAVNVETGPEGNLYYVKLFGDPEKGSIHKISYDPGAPTARLTATPEFGAAPLEVHLDASGSTDPDGEPLKYDWDFDGDGNFEVEDASSKQTRTFSNGTQNRTISVLVKDGTGKSSVAKVTVYPGDTPPKPEIAKPEASLTWGVGQEIEFAGSAADKEEPGEEVPEADLYWKTRLFHCPAAGCHAHPLQVFPGVAEGSLLAPDHEYPSHIEFILTATDSRGLSATKAVSIDARGVNLQIESDPPGVRLGAGLFSQPTPFTAPVIEGSEVTLAAPATALLGDREYEWSGWSDGGERTHTLTADKPATYTATYVPVQASAASDGTPEAPPAPPPGAKSRVALSGHPPKRTHGRVARFAFSSDPPGGRFTCKLDGGRFIPCRSPRVYKHLKPGKHVFQVVALDSGGGAGATPVVFRWRVLAGQPRRHPSAR
ncbi:MAG TPA: PQQ-dependent sugar dehydrogenase [Solirubrobacterales bacterium]|nr:PQQ-dependent sugar dehydrogenase [Solirubrobacterales bacterium]